MFTLRKTRFVVILVTALVLLIPLIAMQFTNEVNWTLSDFMMGGALLLGTGFTLDFLIRKIKNRKHLVMASLFLILILLLVWAELAVGIFGTPLAGS
ncbi:MAG: hypothetical protein AAFP76_10480 [Bacteroidota bacterium]